MMDLYQIQKDLEFLTSPQLTGRLSGTDGARLSAEYLKIELNSHGFDSRLQPVIVPAARLISPPTLMVGDEILISRRDFSEITAFSGAGRIEGLLAVIGTHQLLCREDFKEKIILIPERPRGFDLAATIRSAVELGVLALIIEYGEPQWFTKNVYSGNGRIPVLRVRKSISKKLSRLKGANVKLDLPLQRSDLPCNNVIGYLRGRSAAFTLAITAHYDHLGDDSQVVRFPGAFDNASGVVCVLHTVRKLAKEKLPFNLMVAFLTGEESGFWGAKELVDKTPYPISAIINIDGIGNEPKINTLRLGHNQRGDWMAEHGEKILMKRGIKAQWIGGSDDSSIFISKSIPTLGLGQQPTERIENVMHTPLDTLDSIYLEAILDGSKILKEIVRSIPIFKNQKEKRHVEKN